MRFTAREKRLLRCLLKRIHSRMELGQKVGALNIPHHVMTLRGKGIPIKIKTKAIRDQDNKVTHPGFYFLEEADKRNISELLGSAATNPDNEFQNNLAKQTDSINCITQGLSGDNNG